jgi:hypothetical protein
MPMAQDKTRYYLPLACGESSILSQRKRITIALDAARPGCPLASISTD